MNKVNNLVEVESKLKNVIIMDEVENGSDIHLKLLEVLNDLSTEINSMNVNESQDENSEQLNEYLKLSNGQLLSKFKWGSEGEGHFSKFMRLVRNVTR